MNQKNVIILFLFYFLDWNEQNFFTKKKIGSDIVFGGKTDPTNKYIDPTLVVDPKVDSKLMREEIFGPILPILGVSSPKEAIDFINQR